MIAGLKSALWIGSLKTSGTSGTSGLPGLPWTGGKWYFDAMAKSTFSINLDRIEQLRVPIYEQMAEFSPTTLWQKPQGGGWSFGQNLEHIYKLMRLARWAFAVACVIEKPVVVLRRHRPYTTVISNLFKSGQMTAPPGIRPKDRSSTPIPFETMRQTLDGELKAWRSMAASMAEDIAGHVCVWDPVVGLINMHQAVVLLRFHEEHHWGIVAERLG